MAIYYANSFDDDPPKQRWLLGLAAEAKDCFLCCKPLSYPLIMWMGATGHIFLHEECAPRFVLKLSRDCWELQGARSHDQITENGELRKKP